MSRPEREAFFELKKTAEENGCTAHLGSKLSDVVDPGTMPGDLRGWSTRAHIDVLIRSDDRAMTPLFAVEVDGAQHEKDELQIRRDRAKDAALQNAGVDHVRLESQSVYRSNGRERLATYLANLWFASSAFHDAQDDGRIPYDEVFIPEAFFEPTPDARAMRCLVPTQQLRVRLMEMRDEHGIPMIPYPQSWTQWNRDIARVVVRTMLVLDDSYFLGVETKLGTFRIPGVSPADVAEDLNIVELHSQATEWSSGIGTALARNRVEKWLLGTGLGRPDGHWTSSATSGGVYAWIQPFVSDDTWVKIGGRKSP